MATRGLTVEFDEKKLDAIFAELDQCLRPGAAVGLAIDGKPVYRKAYGLANIELPVVLSPTIRMRMISITKQCTSLAYLLLCEKGKAGLDDPIGKYCPELHSVTHNVTLRQLMGNIGGLRDAHDISWQFSGTERPVSSDGLLSLYRDIDDVNAEPGTAWIYNNGGFLIVSVAIERITGQPLEEVLRECIFEPLGMYDTLLRRSDKDFVPHSATAHMTNSAGAYEKSSFFGTALAGEGGMMSTVNDMLRWLAHMDAPVVGTAATWKTMTTPQTLANGTRTGYGLGLFIGPYRGVETIYHPGGGLGSNAWMLKVPAAGLDVVVMVNRQDVSSGALLYQILDTCVPNLDPIKAVSSRPFIRGIFRSPVTGRVIRFRMSSSGIPPWTREGQQIASVDGRDIPVAPDDDGVLWPEGMAGVIAMKLGITLTGDPANPSSIRVSDFGNLDDLLPVHAVDEGVARAIVGRYRSNSTGTEAIICDRNDGPWLRTDGRFGSAEFKLECLAEGIWEAESPSTTPWVGGILSFNEDGLGFRFSSLRTRALNFLRCPLSTNQRGQQPRSARLN